MKHFAKNTAVKLFIIFVFFTPYQLKSLDFSLSLETRAGLLHGLAQEYVYEHGKEISRLEWDEKAVPYVDTSLVFSWKKLFINANVTSAIPAGSGFIRNYDYLLPDSNVLTHFSEHDVFLDRHNDYSIAAGYEAAIGKFMIIPFAGFYYSNKKWTANNGYYRYASPGESLQGNEPAINITGPIITYEQKISYLFTGVSAKYRFSERWSAQAIVRINPYIWAESLDYHILRDTEFFDEMDGGIGGLLGLAAGFKPIPGGAWEIIAGLSVEKLFHTEGSSAVRTVGISKPSSFVPSETARSGYDDILWRFFMGIRFSTGF